MQLNGKQIVLMILAMLGFVAAGANQLDPIIGVTAAKAVASIAAFVGGLMSAAMTPLLSNDRTVRDASNTTGVEPIRINEQASQSLAALAVDPSITNIGPAPHQYEGVEAKASGATV
jgi:hypothetical protein